jgi:DinB superfamily
MVSKKNGKKPSKKQKSPSKKLATPQATNQDKALRRQLAEVLTWGDAHADWKKALADLPVEKRGVRPEGLPHSPWELLEHARITQWDILDFCTNPEYEAREWPAGYWPKTPAPPDESAWEKSIRAFELDTQAAAKLIENPGTNLFAKIPHGTGQTILREAVLLADHGAYHLGQLVLVRRLLGAWKET